MENCICHSADFCVNFVWALTTLLSVVAICCCIYYSFKIYFDHKENESKRIIDNAKYEFDERFTYEKRLYSDQNQIKDEDLNRSIREKIAVAIIDKVKDSNVDLESAISKADDLKSKLLNQTFIEQ